MKSSEINALKNAFNIPEPKRKEEFLASHSKIATKKRIMPIVLKTASVAAMAALIIGVWHFRSDVSDMRKKPSESQLIITETTTDGNEQTSPDTETTSAATPGGDPGHAVTTSSSGEPVEGTAPQTTMQADPGADPPRSTQTTAHDPELPSASHYASASAVHTTQTTHTTRSNQNTRTQTTQSHTTIRNTVTQTETSRSYEHSTITQTTPTTMAGSGNASPPRDYTVIPDITYSKTGNLITEDDLIYSITGQDAGPPPPASLPYDQMIERSEYVLVGQIDDIFYTRINDKFYTQENITVYAVYKGSDELHPMDRISVLFHGGYMPAEDYMELHGIYSDQFVDYTVYDPANNHGVQNIGDTFVFMLRSSYPPAPDGTFQLTYMSDESVFRYSNGRYYSIGNESFSVSEEELNDLN